MFGFILTRFILSTSDSFQNYFINFFKVIATDI